MLAVSSSIFTLQNQIDTVLVNDTAEIGTGRAKTEPSGKLEALLQRCEDDDIRRGVDRYIQTQPGIRNETATQISRSINRAARECQDGPSVLNNRSPVIDVSGLMTRGEVTVITSGQNRMGNTAAGMINIWTVALFNSVIKRQDWKPATKRRKNLLACDCYGTLPSAPWHHMLAEARKSRSILWLSDSELWTHEEKSAVQLANVQTIIAGRLNMIDAKHMELMMPSNDTKVTDFTTMKPAEIAIKVTTPHKSMPAFRVSLSNQPSPQA